MKLLLQKQRVFYKKCFLRMRKTYRKILRFQIKRFGALVLWFWISGIFSLIFVYIFSPANYTCGEELYKKKQKDQNKQNYFGDFSSTTKCRPLLKPFDESPFPKLWRLFFVADLSLVLGVFSCVFERRKRSCPQMIFFAPKIIRPSRPYPSGRISPTWPYPARSLILPEG